MSEPQKAADYTITPKLLEQGRDAALEQAWFQFRKQVETMMDEAPDGAFFHLVGYVETRDA